MRIIREVRNVLDGKYTIIERDKEERQRPAPTGFRDTESRVVKRLLDLGLAVPQTGDKPKR